MNKTKENTDLYDNGDYILLFTVFPSIAILLFSFIFWQRGWGVLENFVIPISKSISEIWKEQGLTCIVFYASLLGIACSLGEKIKTTISYLKLNFVIVIMLFLYEMLFYPIIIMSIDEINNSILAQVMLWISMILGVSGSSWFLSSIPKTLFMLLDSSFKKDE